ncbi:PLP-dependent aminotransferase family protein [Planctobacterium marinum]|uniref:Transcriptional regulator n=1 Tax=Planctobacterium marinum TaxID=1631968 RepID=A0AA48KSL9_9ALTE|nr:transcriptional regulator [Planctobacterium marinum]
MKKYQQIAQELEAAITKGVYCPGDKLPSIRRLADDLKVAKNTVIAALYQLESKNLIEAQPKSGFTVCSVIHPNPPESPEFETISPAIVQTPELLREIITKGAAFDIKPDETPEPENRLISKLYRLINKTMRKNSARNVSYYDEPEGAVVLREQIARHYSKVGVSLNRNQIAISGGCQHALFMALMATCKPGDNVVIESPGFYGVIQLLDELGLNAIEVPCHNISGIDVNTLQRVVSEYDVRACVVTPAFSTPTGACMPDEAKQTLALLAEEYDFAVIEDDIYGDLGFHFRPKPIKHFDNHERVILCGSFSKSLSRELRVGWISGARWHNAICRLKLVTLLASNSSVQLALAEFMASGDYQRYLKQRVQQLEQNRNALLSYLQNQGPEEIQYTSPIGGLCIWVKLPAQLDTVSLYHKALEQGIVLAPGALFTSHNDFSNYLRLSFCHPLTESRAQALKILMLLTEFGASVSV